MFLWLLVIESVNDEVSWHVVSEIWNDVVNLCCLVNEID
jgi:hypothetical protein